MLKTFTRVLLAAIAVWITSAYAAHAAVAAPPHVSAAQVLCSTDATLSDSHNANIFHGSRRERLHQARHLGAHQSVYVVLMSTDCHSVIYKDYGWALGMHFEHGRTTRIAHTPWALVRNVAQSEIGIIAALGPQVSQTAPRPAPTHKKPVEQCTSKGVCALGTHRAKQHDFFARVSAMVERGVKKARAHPLSALSLVILASTLAVLVLLAFLLLFLVIRDLLRKLRERAAYRRSLPQRLEETTTSRDSLAKNCESYLQHWHAEAARRRAAEVERDTTLARLLPLQLENDKLEKDNTTLVEAAAHHDQQIIDLQADVAFLHATLVTERGQHTQKYAVLRRHIRERDTAIDVLRFPDSGVVIGAEHFRTAGLPPERRVLRLQVVPAPTKDDKDAFLYRAPWGGDLIAPSKLEIAKCLLSAAAARWFEAEGTPIRPDVGVTVHDRARVGSTAKEKLASMVEHLQSPAGLLRYAAIRHRTAIWAVRQKTVK